MTRPKPIPQSQTDAMWCAAAREADWLIAEQRAAREISIGIIRPQPDPVTYAASMPNALIDMVLGAFYSEQHGCPSWWVTEAVAAQLRPLGICEVRGRCLTAFGQTLRRILNAA